MPKFPTFPDCFDEVKTVTIGGLKSLGYMRPGAIFRGTYCWKRGEKPSGWIEVMVNVPERFVQLDYRANDKPITYRVSLERLPAHFGGLNWYFICPVTGKRCRNLYGIGEYFLSRFAYPSAMYTSQTESKRTRELSKAFKCIDLQSDFLEKRHARTTYKGKLTKRYRRIIDREERNWNPETLQRFLHR
ncbi:MAG: hypothetical protein WKF92_12110 [Pyrinomonadaceae bacterium]